MKSDTELEVVSNEDKLTASLEKRYPSYTKEQILEIHKKLLSYISENIQDGYDLAIVKQDDDELILKVLRLVDEESILLGR